MITILTVLEATPAAIFCLLTPPELICGWYSCQHPIYNRVNKNQKYCQDKDCHEKARRETVRINVNEWRRKWRHLYGRSNHSESLGSGFLTSCHPDEDPAEELKMVERELRRLGLR